MAGDFNWQRSGAMGTQSLHQPVGDTVIAFSLTEPTSVLLLRSSKHS